jgi:amidophosphoribosyltransferase|tara:strand:- start:7732 stop:9135 length:1404 start_codon:yes stop_codon:yes gene_type:complete
LKEKCGVVGISANSETDVSTSIFYGLYALQHRGQESCGITTIDDQVYTEKGMGLVPDFFNYKKLKKLKGTMGIGHVRYSTTGGSDIECAQPFVISHSTGTLAISHNGNIINTNELKKNLESSGDAFISSSDTEIIAHLIVKFLAKGMSIVSAITEVMKKLIGSYSLTILTDNEVIGVRDPLGIRPLCLGGTNGTNVLASESVVFDVLNMQFKRDIKPGEIIVITKRGIKSYRPYKLNKQANCMFEYVYFARPDSILNGKSTYKVREKIGALLGEDDSIKADYISPIPDASIPSALGYSKARNIPYIESLIRNRYVGRTFIIPDQKAREIAVKLKLNPVLPNIKGKRVILFDDSIVRGTTSKRIINLLKDSGVKKVHMRVGCPPITSLCKLGIDMPTDKELIANKNSIDEIRKRIGADSLKYLSLNSLIKAIGMDKNKLCVGCLTGKYPIEILKYEQKLLPTFYKEEN